MRCNPVSILLPVLLTLASSPSAQQFAPRYELTDAGTAAYGRGRVAGDVNADGYDDIVIGDWNDSTLANFGGRVTVYSGFDGAILHDIFGDSNIERLGVSCDGAGDVNADGFDDFIAGASGNDVGGYLSGTAFVYSGFDGSVLHAFHGAAPEDYMGWTVGGVGDVDGDGYDDVMATAKEESTAGSNFGRADVFSGFDGSSLITIFGTSSISMSGCVMDGIGDVNGDGIPDFLFGALSAWPSPLGVKVYSGAGPLLYNLDLLGIFPGWGDARRAGDVNGDGVGDIVLGAPSANGSSYAGVGIARVYSGLGGSVIHHIEGPHNDSDFGAGVCGVGDVNGDGLDDFAVGAPGSDVAGPSSGSVTVFSGATGAPISTVHGAPSDHLGTSPDSGFFDGFGRRELMARRDVAVTVWSADPSVGRGWPGSVGDGTAGGPFDVLAVNGASGAPSRTVSMPPGTPITLDVTTAVNDVTPAPFVLWATIGLPIAGDGLETPFGDLVLLPHHFFQGQPGLVTLANSFYLDPLALIPSQLAPWSVTVDGPPFPLQMTIQGVILRDDGDLDVTNAVLVDVQ